MLSRIAWISFTSAAVMFAQSSSEQSGPTVDEITWLEHEVVANYIERAGSSIAKFRDSDYIQVTGNGSVFDPARIAATESQRQSAGRRFVQDEGTRPTRAKPS